MTFPVVLNCTDGVDIVRGPMLPEPEFRVSAAPVPGVVVAVTVPEPEIVPEVLAVSVICAPAIFEFTAIPPPLPVARSDKAPDAEIELDIVIPLSGVVVPGVKLSVTLTALPVDAALIVSGPLD